MDINPWEMLEKDPVIKTCVEQKLRLVAPLYEKKKILKDIVFHLYSRDIPHLFPEHDGRPTDIISVVRELLGKKPPAFLENFCREKDFYDSIERIDRDIIAILK